MSIKTKPKQDDLGLKGQGVEPVTIPEIEAAADAFAETHDDVQKLKEDEATLKENLKDAIHKHMDKLPRGTDGAVSYRYGERIVVLKPSKENVSVKSIHDDQAQVEVEE